ncbi:MAG: FeoC-like transcriptional regulator [Granulosicoccaceae bacterium]
MLEILLRIVASKGTECSFELAHRLDVSHALMENMLDELTRQGYLKVVVGGRPVPCERCPMHTACMFQGRPRIWALSPKGESLLARRAEARAS